MSFESFRRNPETRPEFEPQPADSLPKPTEDRTKRALGRTAISSTTQAPSSARSEQVQRALGRSALEGPSGATRSRSRERS